MKKQDKDKTDVKVIKEEDIKIDVKKIKKEKKKSTGLARIIAISILLILVVVGICFLFIPLFNNLKFGLDLQGGFEVLYKAESIDGSKMTNEKLTATYKTLSKRIDSLGVSEPEIVLEGNDRIRVKLAGVTDPEEARKQLSTVATLSFRDTDDKLLMDSSVIGGAKVGQDSSGNPAVALTVKNTDKFYAVTKEISTRGQGKNYIVIWLDYNQLTDHFSTEQNRCGTDGSSCLSAATVSQGFASDVIIQGNFTSEEVENLVDLINSGSLPSKLTEISSNTVGASFGDATLQKTLVAGIIGVVAIVILMLFVYHFAGFVASVAMMIYAFLVFLIFWLVGGVLTLPGIAALVLGVGMAVDSTVITFARIKDELYSGRSLENAFKIGSKSSLSSIIDGNITTLLVAIIMFIFGESSIKGFSTMLIITIIVTMFTMVFLNRVLLGIFAKNKFFTDKTRLFINVKKEDIPNVNKGEEVKVVPFKNVNFFKYKKLLVGLSLSIILIGGVFYFTKGFNLGIDYKAGTSISINTDKKVTKSDINKDLKELKLTTKKASININDKDISIRTVDTLNGDKVKNVNDYFVNKYNAKVNVGVVSNVVAKELVKNAIISVLIALLGIILYVSIRFKFSYAIGGVIALVHDVLIMISVFAIFRLEVSSMFIAAVLAIIGYSINDTIVLYDRIRENLSKNRKKLTSESLTDIVNSSIGQTFNRTIITSVTTILPVIALLILGSREILTFNVAILVGLICGTYSSIFIATLLFLTIEKKNLGKPKKEKKKYDDDIKELKVKGINC